MVELGLWNYRVQLLSNESMNWWLAEFHPVFEDRRLWQLFVTTQGGLQNNNNEGDALRLPSGGGGGCKLQILAPLRVFGTESHYIFPLSYRLELCVKKFTKKKQWCLFYCDGLLLGSFYAGATPTLVSLRGLILIWRRAFQSLLYRRPPGVHVWLSV